MPSHRRAVLAAPPAESINGKQPELAALGASVGSTTGTEQALWYYGVALRCGRDTGDQRSAASGG